MNELLNLQSAIAFVTLCALELILGVDNIIFISILSGKLPKADQQRARTLGLSLAVLTRTALLLSLSWIIGLTEPLFSVLGRNISGRDLILFVGGMFLIAKATHEIHQKLEAAESSSETSIKAKFSSVILQILILDIVFSLDSVITAVGMVNQIAIMIAAVLVSTGVMIFTAKPLSDFVDRHPTIKMLALSFLLMIGFTLVVEAFGQHISKGYIYFAMGFSLFVETLNIRLRKKSKPLHLRSGL